MVIRLLLLLLLLVAPLAAEPLSFTPKFECQLCPEGTELAPPVRGDPTKTMELVWELYRQAGPKLGCRFVEPCYLLCLADLRPYGAWNGFLVDPQSQDDEIIDRLNRFLVPRGYSLHPRKARPDGKVDSFSVHSLEGLDKRTRESRLSWVPRYHRETGWPGYYRWKEDVYRSFASKQAGFDKVEGILLGYPDPAVDHFEELTMDDWPATIEADLPLADYYDCGVPIFSLRWQDAADPAVVACEQEWNGFLESVYATPEHQRLAADPDFLRERRRKLTSRARSDQPVSSVSGAEGRRLGYSLDAPSGWQLSSRQERWFRTHYAQLERACAETSDLAALAQGSGGPGLTGRSLWLWLLRGSAPSDPASASWFAEYRRRHPQVLATQYRRALYDRCRGILRRGPNPNPDWDGRGLYEMVNTAYCQGLLPDLTPAEQRAVFQALELRRGYPPLQALIDQANAGRGPYAPVLRQLRQTSPELWKP